MVVITGSADMGEDGYNIINRIVHEKADHDAQIKIGVMRDDNMGDNINVAVYLSKVME